MARVPLIDESHGALAALIAKLKGARGGKLLNLYRVLLNSPRYAEAWQEFNSVLRFESALDEQARELAIMRVAHLNRSSYQFNIHASKYAPACGLTPAQVAALAGDTQSDQFSPAQRALLAYTDAMTTTIEVPDAVYEALRARYSNQQIVELTVLIGAYNMHTRVGVALKIDPE